MQMRKSVIGMAACAALAACGGGGGGGSDGGSSGDGGSSAAAALSASNYEVAANEVVATSLGVTDLVGQANIVTGASVSTQPNWAKIGWQQWLAARAAWNATPTLAGATTPTTISCSGGGNLLVTVNDANNNNTFDGGDSLSVTANSCVESGVTVGGSFSASLTSNPSGDPTGCVYGIALAFTFQSFTATDSGGVATANGQLTLSSTRTACSTGTDSIGASTFSESFTAAGATRSRSLIGYSATVAFTPTQSTTTLAGTLTSTALNGGSLTITTPTPFVRAYNTEAFPHAGVGVATGANGGKVTVTALSSTTVRVDLDANGDGTPEATVTKPWSTFE
jgi:hypothetical protein